VFDQKSPLHRRISNGALAEPMEESATMQKKSGVICATHDGSALAGDRYAPEGGMPRPARRSLRSKSRRAATRSSMTRHASLS
jgi:hypothetical protein